VTLPNVTANAKTGCFAAYSSVVPRRRVAGRGRHCAPWRTLVEWVLGWAFVGDWPAHAWSLAASSARVRVVERTLPMLPARDHDDRERRDRLRIAFASDLHFGPTTSMRTLERARSILVDARPDVLLLGGDYVFLDATPKRTRALADWVASIPATTKLAVFGNHDLWTDHHAIESALRRAGARVLVNECVRLPSPFDDIAIAGLDEPWTGAPDPDETLRARGDASLTIGLSHSPDALPLLSHRGVALLVVGHTHGGMIARPGGRPIVMQGRMGRKYPHGFHVVDDTLLFVSRGLGGVEVPVRAWAPPDVVVLDLVPAKTRVASME
jgi:predicted MPP superfamily phosphohydrolase